MDDSSRGMYQKFKVERTDGSSVVGGKHEHCRYFVLDLDHDCFAASALAAYADACRSQFPVLAGDIEKMIGRNDDSQFQDNVLRAQQGVWPSSRTQVS
jgi:hypothetical protein